MSQDQSSRSPRANLVQAVVWCRRAANGTWLKRAWSTEAVSISQLPQPVQLRHKDVIVLLYEARSKAYQLAYEVPASFVWWALIGPQQFEDHAFAARHTDDADVRSLTCH